MDKSDINCEHRCDRHDQHKKGKSSFWMQDSDLVFRKLDLQSGDFFLDLGCGPGDYSIRASQIIGNSGRVYALDRNPDSIADLRNKVVSEGLKNITAEVCDISGPLPVKDGSVDICFLSTVLHSLNLADVEETLFSEIRRVLKPSGRVAIIECKKEVQPCGPPIDMRISPEELEGIITQYGFERISLTDLGYNYLIQFEKAPEILPDQCGQTSGDIVLRPVGVIKNRIVKPFLVADGNGLQMQGDLEDALGKSGEMLEEVSNIIIDESLAEILEGIDEYSHLIILYWAHKVPEDGRSLTKVHPMGRESISKKGIFSTCSPARPNPVLMTVVRLKERKSNVLEVFGLEAVDGSPVVDIKPYVKDFYPQEEVRIPVWMRQLQDEVGKVKSRNQM
ncbi:MAG: S-adenosyl-L-methionine-binding protein [Methanosaeta sp. PtaU1.Bin112]|nr:MAG: S-adenosyl-L-methionine-binding protein [Methanosaeta sp. PtaU1.Bin112]